MPGGQGQLLVYGQHGLHNQGAQPESAGPGRRAKTSRGMQLPS